MYEVVDINQIINFLSNDDELDDEGDLNLFSPETIAEERNIIEYYVKKYCSRESADVCLMVKSNFESAGRFCVQITGFDSKIDFVYIIH